MAKEGLGLEITELRLGLPESVVNKNEKKRAFSEIDGVGDENSSSGGDDRKVEKKSQVVGWPPVCSYRKKNSVNEASKMYVKVSMDGAPFLRKIDLAMHKGYSDLAFALENLFDCYGMGKCYILLFLVHTIFKCFFILVVSLYVRVICKKLETCKNIVVIYIFYQTLLTLLICKIKN